MRINSNDFKKLKPHATKRQSEILDAVHKHGTHRAAARALGINQSAVSRSLQSLFKKANHEPSPATADTC